MLKLAVFVLVAGVVAECALLGEHEFRWSQFKTKHSKKYDTKEEEALRRQIFIDNLEFIEKHNSEGHSFKLGFNEYADWTNTEFRDFMNGYSNKPSKLGRTHLVHRATLKDDLPMMVDWRSKGYVTPVKNQKQCGSCWAFSTTGSLEGQHFNKTGKLVSLSEQNLMDCSRPEGNMGCDGGLMDQAFEYIKINNGVDTEASYPYTAMDGECRFMRANVGATDVGYVDVEKMNEAALKDAVAMVGPVSVAIDASRRTFQLYESGVYVDKECSSTQLDHGVLAVGYGTEMGKDYWLVKNSWGETWGMSGYIKMARNAENMCGIATSASYPLV